MEGIVEAYCDPSNPGSFGGADRLSKNITCSKKVAEKAIQKLEAYTKNKQIRNKFKRRRVVVPCSMYLWQADLIVLPKYSRNNKGYKYILTVIDCFSKKAHAVLLKTKTGVAVANAFSDVFSFMKGTPRYLQTDQGKEFFNNCFIRYLKKYNVVLFHTYSDLKASIVERFNRTLMTRLQKIFTHRKKPVYYDILSNVLDSYNNSFHSSIKMTPNDVCAEKEFDIWLSMNKSLYQSDWSTKAKFNVGDTVRVKIPKTTFEKGYAQNYTDDLFVISKVCKTKPITFHLKENKSQQKIHGSFYSEELSKHKNE